MPLYHFYPRTSLLAISSFQKIHLLTLLTAKNSKNLTICYTEMMTRYCLLLIHHREWPWVWLTFHSVLHVLSKQRPHDLRWHLPYVQFLWESEREMRIWQTKTSYAWVSWYERWYMKEISYYYQCSKIYSGGLYVSCHFKRGIDKEGVCPITNWLSTGV